MMSHNVCRLYDLSTKFSKYEQVWKMQKILMENMNNSRKSECSLPDALLIVQHPSTYTLGRGATLDNLKFSVDCKPPLVDFHRIERGGDVTWHGPGQLVLYPVLDLHRHKKDLHWYMRSLEQVVIDTLKDFNVDGTRNEVNAGVWINQNKISAVGVTASRWITMHGIAINVNCDMTSFEHIIPCGIQKPGYGVCKLQQYKNDISISETKNSLIRAFSRIFNLELCVDDIEPLEQNASNSHLSLEAHFPL